VMELQSAMRERARDSGARNPSPLPNPLCASRVARVRTGSPARVLSVVTALLVWVSASLGAPGTAVAVAAPDSITPVYSEYGSAPQVAPVSGDFASYVIERLSPFASLGLVAQGDYAPSPVSAVDDAVPGEPALGAGELPASYDLRTTGKLTPVRNQGAYGTCWAFASYASLESAMMPGDSRDFSEDHLALGSGFFSAASTPADLYNNGGNYEMSTAYAARWSGPVAESDQPYGTGHVIPGLASRAHVQDVDFLPTRTGPADNGAIKSALMQLGAVGTSMYYTGSAYRSAAASYYYSGTRGSNHAVDIVGWNDEYPASNFAATPPAPGAWLVRNSWGSYWGAGGYFWVSYCDSRFANDLNVVFKAAEPTTNYARVLQYDTLGYTSSLGYGSETGWFMNKFPIDSASSVKAASFYAGRPGSVYELYAGTGAGLTKVATGTLGSAGYHTVDFDSPVNAQSGQTLSVAVKLTTPGRTYPICVERAYVYYSDQATCSAGQGFLSSDGTHWQDAATSVQGSVCLKAFVDPDSSDRIAPTTTSSATPSPNAAGWNRTPVSVSLVATDAGSGVLASRYRLGSGTPATYTAPIEIGDQGTTTVQYWSVDQSGNVEPTRSAEVRIDSGAPEVSLDASPSYVGTATIHAVASDGVSGIDRVEMSVDATDAWSGRTQVSLSEGGAHTVFARAYDTAGNLAETSATFTLAMPPETTVHDLPEGWVNHEVVFSLTASCASSPEGIITYYGLDGPASTPYSEAVTIAAEGTTTISYYSIDASGHAETPKAAVARIDRAAPETTDDHVDWYSGGASVSLVPSDALSGAVSTSWTLDGVAGHGTVVAVSVPGTHTLVYSSTDGAGNAEPARTATFTVVPAPVVVTHLSAPWVSPATPRHGRTVTFRATLAPGTAATSASSRLVLLRRQSKTVTRMVKGRAKRVKVTYWHSRGTVLMRGSASGGLTATARLPRTGTWAAYVTYAGCSSYTPARSGTRVFRVK
jgi:C1A family cysteine protease